MVTKELVTKDNQNREMFRSTRVWRELISLLQDQVALKRRRYLTRTNQAVFSGANAVDVLLRHVQKNPDLVERVFDRTNVQRLCQRFLDQRVFFPAREKIGQKNIFEDSHFTFYRFNINHDFIGSVDPNQKARGLKRCNSETDLISILPCSEQKATLTKQLSAISCRLRKSIRRRSSSNHKDTKLASINEEGLPVTPRLTKFGSIQEVSESPKIQRKKSVRRSLQMKSPSTVSIEQKSSERRITRSNAFRATKSVQGRRVSCGDSGFNGNLENLENLDDSDRYSLLNATISGCPNISLRVPKRTLKSVAMEQRKRVKSIANFSLNLSVVL